MIGYLVSRIFGPFLKGEYGIFSSYFIYIFGSDFESYFGSYFGSTFLRSFGSTFLKGGKCGILRQCIVHDKSFINNDITNLVCTKPNMKNNFDRTFAKIKEQSENIFRISPRALVFCVLHKNVDMLKYIRSLGYPLEMIAYADNYSLVKKRYLQNFIFHL